MDWKRGEVASRVDSPRQLFCRIVLLRKYAASRTNIAGRVKFLLGLGGGGGGLGAGCSGLDGPSAPRRRQEPCSPSIRKRCARGFPQGTAEPLRHASNNFGSTKLSCLM